MSFGFLSANRPSTAQVSVTAGRRTVEAGCSLAARPLHAYRVKRHGSCKLQVHCAYPITPTATLALRRPGRYTLLYSTLSLVSHAQPGPPGSNTTRSAVAAGSLHTHGRQLSFPWPSPLRDGWLVSVARCSRVRRLCLFQRRAAVAPCLGPQVGPAVGGGQAGGACTRVERRARRGM